MLNTTNTDDSADNNIVDGPAVVTLAAGQYFQSQGCAKWVPIH